MAEKRDIDYILTTYDKLSPRLQKEFQQAEMAVKKAYYEMKVMGVSTSFQLNAVAMLAENVIAAGYPDISDRVAILEQFKKMLNVANTVQTEGGIT